jgi:4-hydroxy-tetrahydrodipicolinate reductase
MVQAIKAVQFGFGPIGCSIVRLAAQKKGIKIVGGIDLDNAGRKIGEVAGIDSNLIISDDAKSVLEETRPDIVLHATGSVFSEVYPQLEVIMESGARIISTCEEISFPYYHHSGLANELDETAKSHNTTVLSTGVNPGFLMDTWPLFMTGICQEVNEIKVVRVQDASRRRVPFQKKIGAGKTVEEFEELVKEKTIRHVGLPESIAMISTGLGWVLDEIEETIEPVLAETEISSEYITVRIGQAAGVRQVGRGVVEGKGMITLDFQAYLGAPKPYDAVYVTGTQNLEVVIEGGVHGDLATAATVVNAIPRVITASPGLVTMLDLPIMSAMPKKSGG